MVIIEGVSIEREGDTFARDVGRVTTTIYEDRAILGDDICIFVA